MNKEEKNIKSSGERKGAAKPNKNTAKAPTIKLPETTAETKDSGGATMAKTSTKALQQPESGVKTTAKNLTAEKKSLTFDLQAANDDNFNSSLQIDASVFDDSEDGDISFMQEITRSRTIDGSMLSSERVSKSKKARKSVSKSELSYAERYNPDASFGLSAEQVQKRVADGFVNTTGKKTGKSYGSIFVSNIFTFFNMLTFAVAIALIIVGAEFSKLVFILIIILNISLGIFQEIRSKRAVDRLSIMTAPTAIVIRNGEKMAIPVSEVVLDDIIFLESGKQICADAIVISGEIEVNESMLTGESDAMKKPSGAELYSGSYVTSGNCFARVDKIGSANYVETLTSYAKRYRKPKSELNSSIRLIMRVISIVILPMTVLMLFNNYRSLGTGWEAWRVNITAVSGAVVGMIPAGMFLLTSTALFVSVLRLAKKRILVQDLYCIEMLARVDVLCLDKTGTITDGTMQVNNVIEIKGGESQYSFSEIIGSMLTATGDNNQTAMALADYFGYSKLLRPSAIVPFSSKRKLSAVSFEGAGTYMFGAPEFVLKDVGVRIEKLINDNAANGYRVLCLAHSPAEMIGDKLPAVRRPLCLIVIEDHIREDAIETVKWFKDNNVAVKVISGDNPITVSEVAKRVGVDKAELYISLDGLSNQEVIEAAKKYTVFGRVSPEQKKLIIKVLKTNGHTVAMTGDGVNDILAMREADCSISIASGAEAARNVSHLVLQDSNFTSMPDVVREGRRVVNNIQKASSLFLMKTFMSIVLSVVFLIIPFVNKVAYFRYPYETNHLLMLEFFVIAFPSFVLALQKNDKLIRGSFLSNVIGRCVPGGITLVAVTMVMYFYNLKALPIVTGTDGTVYEGLYKTMLVLGMVLTGLMLLIKTCEPFDTPKTIMVLVVIILITLSIYIIPSFFGMDMKAIELKEMFFIGMIIMGSYFFASIMMKIMRALKVLN